MNKILPSKAVLTSCLLLAFVLSGCSPEAKKARHLKNADEYFEAGEFEKARIAYLNVVSIDENHPQALERLGTIYFDRGELGPAFQLLGRSKTLNPENIDVRERIAFIFRSAGQLVEARNEAVEILERQPTNENALLMLADTVTSRALVEDSFERLEELRPEAGETAPFHRALGNLHIRLQQFDSAREALERALSIDPESAGAHLDLAGLEWVRGDLEAADRSFARAAELSPAKSVSHLRRVDFKIKTGRLDEAKEILNAVTEEAPDFASALVYLAQIALAERDFETCRELVDRVNAESGQNIQALVLDARVDLAEGETATGAEKLERLAERFSEVPLVHYWLGLARLQNGESTPAMQSLDRVVRLNPTFEDAVLILAELKLRSGDAAAAVSDLERIVEQRPGVLRARVSLARAYMAAGRFQETVAVCDVLLAQRPEDTGLLQIKGVALRRLGRGGEARAMFDQVLGLRPGALDTLAQLIEMDVEDGAVDVALSRISAYVESDPEPPALAAALHIRSRLHRSENDVDAAIADLKRVIEVNPTYVQAYFDLARLYSEGDLNDEALAELENGLKQNPDHVPSLTLSGILHEGRGDYTTAAQRYERLLAVVPDSPLGLNNLAYVYGEKLNRPDDAFDLATRARRIALDSAGAGPRGEASTLDTTFASYSADTLGWILFRRGDYRRAAALVRESAERLGEVPEVQYHLGMTTYMMGDTREARRAFERALELDPDLEQKASAQARLAVLAMDETDPDQFARLESRVGEDPQDVVALTKLGRALSSKGRYEEAKALFGRALEVNGETIHTILPLARLEAEQLGDATRALELLRRAQGLAGGDPESLLEMGNIAFRSGDFVWANRLLGEVATRGELNAEGRFHLARSEIKRGNLREAGALMAALASEPDASPWSERAKVFQRLLHTADSRAVDKETTDLAREVMAAEPGEELAGLILAFAAEQAGDPGRAAELYESVLRANSGFGLAAKHLATLLAGSLDESERAFDLALNARRQMPNDVELTRLLGRLVYDRGDFDWATRLLREGTADGQGGADDFFHLGMGLHQLGRTEESTAALNRALSLDLAPPLAAQARAALAGE